MVKNIFLIILIFSLPLFANVGKIVALKGDVTIERENQSFVGKVGTEVFESDEIFTKNNSKIQLLLNDNTVITIGNNSHFKINQYLFDEKNEDVKANFGLLKGAFRTITGKIGKIAPSKFKLNSKTSSIGIRGTQILSKMAIDGDKIVCVEGEITITHLSSGKLITIKAGEFVDLSIDNDNLKVQTLTQSDIKGLDENTRFLLKEEESINLKELGVEIAPVEDISWGEWEDKKNNIEDIYEQIVKLPEESEDIVQEVSDTTDPDYIINATNSAYYVGNLSGSYGADTLDVSQSYITLDIDFGTKQIYGSIEFMTNSSTFGSEGFEGSVKSDGTGFTIEQDTSSTWDSLSGSGTFHGDSANSLKGNINGVSDTATSLNATFEAELE